MGVANVTDKMLQVARFIDYVVTSDVFGAISSGVTGENGLGGRRLTSAT